MNFFSTIAAPLPADFPNPLNDPAPARRALPSARWTLAALLLLALVPRIWMAWRIDTLCPDGVLYIQLAQSLDRGDLGAALEGMHLNTYPVILLAGHRLGFDWQAFGEWWGVLMGTLAVWPLFNWTRRQFDDRVALFGGVLYAIHPKLIEWSPELVRDPTFWFLLALALDQSWRAITEVRLTRFLIAGAAITLCVLTRFEGLFLALPLVGWLAARAWALRSQRARLWFGAVVCLAAFPAILVAVNLWFLAGHGQFEALRLEPWQRAQQWIASWQGQATQAAGVAVTQDHSTGGLAWLFTQTVLRGLTITFGFFMLVGYLGWRRVWDRRDHVPMFLFTVAVLVGIWIHVWFAHVASSRYVMSVVIVSTRCAGLGLLAIARALVLIGERLAARARWDWIAVAPLVVVTILGCTDAVSHYDQGRRLRAELGRWVQAEYGAGARLVCSDDLVRVVGYYAQGQAQTVLPFTDQHVLLNVLNGQRPEVIALTTDRMDPAACLAVLDAAPRLGLDVSRWGAGLPTRDKMMILVARRTPPTAIAPLSVGDARGGPEPAGQPR